ncbi:class I SAM-dependent methyltransferase [Glaciecola sp. SC05]|uniref:class I SAM-dependent DNA methyltransferase n=1 Tax=Glaciecola sp. SC05 TaxID=1987355 RepID=UPI003527C6B7
MLNDYFATKAKEYEKNSTRVTNVANISQAIRKRITFSTGMKIMDFGSGTGLLLKQIAPLVKEITAIDVSESMMNQLVLQQDTIECELRPLILDLQHQDLDTQFDGIISSMTMHHIEDVPLLFKRLFDLLVPGGFIAIADIDTEDGSFHEQDTGVHHHGFERDWIMQEVSNAGFSDIRIETASEIDKPQGLYSVFLLTGFRE